jgi:hypothetical protein
MVIHHTTTTKKKCHFISTIIESSAAASCHAFVTQPKVWTSKDSSATRLRDIPVSYSHIHLSMQHPRAYQCRKCACSTPHANSRSCCYSNRWSSSLDGRGGHLATHQVPQIFPMPKWNFWKWRMASFLFFQFALFSSAQSPHSNRSSTFSKNPSYA